LRPPKKSVVLRSRAHKVLDVRGRLAEAGAYDRLIDNDVGVLRKNAGHFARVVVDEEGAAVDLAQDHRRRARCAASNPLHHDACPHHLAAAEGGHDKPVLTRRDVPLDLDPPPIAWRTGDVGVATMRLRRARLLRFESTITTPVKKRPIPRKARTSIKPDIVVLLRGIYHHRPADMNRSVHGLI
jgi:hypothetical protein